MQRNPNVTTEAEAINVLFGIHARLSSLVMWLLFAVAHLAVAIALVVWCWVFQVTPTDLWAWIQQTQQSMPVATLGAVGVSVLTVLGAYWWFLRKLHYWAGTGWMANYLMKNV